MVSLLTANEKIAIIKRLIKGNLRDIEYLGGGSFGKVYKIDDYIVKQIEIIDMPSFRKEVEIWEEFTFNENLTGFIPEYRGAAVRDDNKYGYIIQTYEPVQTMYEFINRYVEKKSLLNFEQGFSLFYNLIIGFAEIHRSGYIHRDIKEHNILIRTSGNIGVPIIIDFGLVCKLPCDSSNMHILNTPAGTPGFIVPNTIDKSYSSAYPKSTFPIGKKFTYANRIKSLFYKEQNRKITVQLKNQKLKGIYNVAADNYALSLVLDELFKIIDWDGHIEDRLAAKEKIAKLKGQILPYLVSQSAKQSGKAFFPPNRPMNKVTRKNKQKRD